MQHTAMTLTWFGLFAKMADGGVARLSLMEREWDARRVTDDEGFQSAGSGRSTTQTLAS